MPQMGVSVVEGTIVAWRVGVGDTIEADQTICEISTDKIDTEVPAPASGVVAEILVEVDATVDVGTVLARISGGGGSDAAAAPDAAAASVSAADPAPAAASSSAAASHGPVTAAAPSQPAADRRYSPVVSRIAAEHDIDLSAVHGTGRGGRVRKQDVLALVGAHRNGAANGHGAAEVADPPLHIES